MCSFGACPLTASFDAFFGVWAADEGLSAMLSGSNAEFTAILHVKICKQTSAQNYLRVNNKKKQQRQCKKRRQNTQVINVDHDSALALLFRH